MFDPFNRRIHYLRVSVTDRCNLACGYCRPAETPPAERGAAILSYEEIRDLVAIAVPLGIDKVRLTGGEPLMRRDIVTLVRMLAAIPGLQDLAMTTNGALLAPLAIPLRQAGLQRLNISLDTTDPDRFREIAGAGDVADVLAGIEAALAADFRRIKLNCVVEQSADEPDARLVAQYGQRHGLEVQFIRRMDMEAGRFWPVIGGKGGRCDQCDRLRVSSDGMIYPCLFNDICFSIRDMGVEAALRAAVGAKPQSGRTSRNKFYAIGG